MGRSAPVPESCTTGFWPGLADAVPVTPVPKPRGPPTVSMLQRAAYCPTPPRTTHLSDACQANSRRGITLVFVLYDCVGAPLPPTKETEPGVLVTGLVIVGLKPPKWFWT